MLAKLAQRCRLCNKGPLETIFDLGVQALAGRFPNKADVNDVPIAPLQLVKCGDCHLVQLAHNFEVNELFGYLYGYRSGINATMRIHLKDIVSRIEDLLELGHGDIVLDIASNDGTLLKSYSAPQINRVGIDPTIKQYKSMYPEDIVTAPTFFTAEIFQRLYPDAKARVITSIAIIYDLPEPNAFVADISSILAHDGIWVMEQSDLGMMLHAGAFDTICHEHLEYYGLRQIKMLVEAHGLRIFDVQFNEINGGSAQIYVCRRDGPYRPIQENLDEAERIERTYGLEKHATYKKFRRTAAKTREVLRTFLVEAREAGKTVHAYGASTKGNVLLQYCGIDQSLVAAVADRNPDKWGRQTPGSNIPIISEEESRAAEPDYYLVLPWHFRTEFIQREADFFASGGHMVFPLPKFEIYPSIESNKC